MHRVFLNLCLACLESLLPLEPKWRQVVQLMMYDARHNVFSLEESSPGGQFPELRALWILRDEVQSSADLKFSHLSSQFSERYRDISTVHPGVEVQLPVDS